MYTSWVKRFIDFTFSLLSLVVLFPLFLIVWLLVRIKVGKPAFFVQERLGKSEKPFMIYKFRSMTEAKDESGHLLPEEQRLTRFGKKLRSLSLDELPELWNILCGDMSIVGPRPLPSYYRPFYTEIERHRHDVRPGLTGLAQVKGRNYITWENKFSLDNQYIQMCNILLDIKIVIQTIFIVLRCNNIETASQFEHNGIIYMPLDVERRHMMRG